MKEYNTKTLTDENFIKWKDISAFSWIRGFLIGLITGLADFLGPLGTGTGIVITVLILSELREKMSKSKKEEGNEGKAELAN